VRAAFLQRCEVQATGDVVLSGRGALEAAIIAGGDVSVRAPGSTIRGGIVRAGGVVVAHELGAPSGAGLRVVLDGPRRGVRLVAGLAHAGVEVVCGGRLVTIEAATLNLSLAFDEENRVTRSGTPAS
jgi:hypothetical protein